MFWQGAHIAVFGNGIDERHPIRGPDKGHRPWTVHRQVCPAVTAFNISTVSTGRLFLLFIGGQEDTRAENLIKDTYARTCPRKCKPIYGLDTCDRNTQHSPPSTLISSAGPCWLRVIFQFHEIFQYIEITNQLAYVRAMKYQIIKNVQIFSPKNVGKGHVLTGGVKIAAILKNPITFPKEIPLTEIDGKGKILIPGLIDGHTHITGGGGESGPNSRIPPRNVSEFTSAGVTTVVGLLGTDDVTRNTETLVTQARGLTKDGITAYCHTGGYHYPCVTLTGSVARDITFIDPIIGVGEIAISDHRSSQITLDELLRLASEAHVAGLYTGKAGIVHLHLGNGKRGLKLVKEAIAISEIPARVFNPTHVNRRGPLFEEACALAALGCTIDLTTTTVRKGDEKISADEALCLYLDKKLPPDRVTVSSDGGGCLPVFNKEGELIEMTVGNSFNLLPTVKKCVVAGKRLEEVLPAFTGNVAKILRLPHKGRIEAGCDADLVLLNEDFTVDAVMARGVWHVRDGKTVIKGQFES